MIFWKLNTEKFVKQYLGRMLYKPLHFNWLVSLLKPLQITIDDYSAWLKRRYYLLNITGQTISLEAFLNDEFDVDLRRIKILTANSNYNGIWIALEEEVDMFITLSRSDESEDVFIYFCEQSEQGTSIDFIVQVPAEIATTDVINQIKSIVNRYKLAGKSYQVDVV